jgi:DNA-binding NtrC family response regulator
VTKPGSTLPRTIDAPDPTRRGPVLNVVLSARHIETPASRHKLDGVVGVSVGRGEVASIERRDGENGPRLVIRLADGRVSSKHLELTRALGRWVAEDAGSRNGTFVNGEAVRRAVLVDGDILEVGDTFLQFVEAGALGDEPDDVSVSLDSGAGRTTLLPTLAAALARLPLVARSDESVLVRGASGTGKELIARAVHDLSGRRGAFVAVNCGALPEAMVEAELFGHKKGAFSGAAGERAGLVRAADGGTLFLDEIGDLRLGSQAALLRVLQEKQVRPIGSDAPVDVDLRVVCATHRPLDSLVADGDFRGDLLARLRGFVVELPDLRARRADLGLLVAALLRRYQPEGPLPTLSGAAARALFAYAWPYNVRELEKCVSTALTLAAGGPIRLEHLPEPVRASAAAAALNAPAPSGPSVAGSAPSNTAPGSVDPDDEADEATPANDGSGEPRRVRLVRLMREYQGNVAAVARVMGKGRTQIHRWLERYGINPDEYR